MMVECPNCGAAMFTKNGKPRKKGIYILYKCKSCGHTENNRNPNLKPAKDQPTNLRKLDETAIADIRQSKDSAPTLAARYGCSVTTIARARRGNTYKAESASCYNCTFWDLEAERCREGWPDPLTDGPRYANECRDYTARRR